MDSSIVFCSAGLCFILVWKYLLRGHATVEIDEYLNVLCRDTWKSESEIKTEMEQYAGGWLTPSEVRVALTRLNEEGLIECRLSSDYFPHARQSFGIRECHLTIRGNWEKNKLLAA